MANAVLDRATEKAPSAKRARNGSGNGASSKSAVAEAARLKGMLDHVPANVMLANLDFDIVYVNQASLRTLKTIEQHLPIPANLVQGANIDVFHKAPQQVRRILSDPRNLPHKVRIQIGPESATLEASAVYDDEGRYVGPMVTWELTTERERMEAQNKENAAVIAGFQEFLADMRHMSDEHDRGDIDVTMHAETYAGDLRVAAEGINRMVAGHIAVKKQAMACVAEFGKGNFDAPLERFPGKKASRL